MLPATHPTDKWLIIFLVCGDAGKDNGPPAPNEVQRLLNYIQNELIHSELDENKYTIYLAISGGNLEVCHSTSKTDTKTSLYQRLGQAGDANNKLYPIDRAFYDMRTGEGIAGIFEHIKACENNKFTNTFIITGGHGSALGIFKYSECFLSNEAFANAIRNNFGKADVLLMMNCYMANLHAAYAFAGSVKYLVAPQTSIGAPGCDLSEIINYMHTSTLERRTMDARQLATACVRFSMSESIKADAVWLGTDPAKIDEYALLALHLDHTDDSGQSLGSFLDELNILLGSFLQEIENNAEVRSLFKYARRYSYDFSAGDCYMIDLLNWLYSVQYASFGILSHSLEIELSTFIGLARKFIDGMVTRNEHDLAIYKSTYGAITCHAPNGMSIYFPWMAYNKKLLRTNSLAIKVPNWDVFLEAIL